MAIPEPSHSPEMFHVVILLVGLSRSVLKTSVQPSTPREFWRRSHSVMLMEPR